MSNNQIKLNYPPDYVELGIRKPFAESIEQSYLTNTLRFNFGSQVIIRPLPVHQVEPASAEVQRLFGPAFPFYFLTGWNPNGEPTTYNDNIHTQLDFRDRLKADGIISGTGFARAKDGGWIEAWCYTTVNIGDEKAREIAKSAGQLVAYRWDLEGLHVLSTDVSVVSEYTLSYEIEILNDRPCQLKLEDSADPCKSEGGPWVGKSIAMAAIWQAHRNLALQLAGCGTCHIDPMKHGENSGDAIATQEVGLASRFGGYQWGSESRPARAGTHNPGAFKL